MKGSYNAAQLLKRPSERTIKGIVTFGAFFPIWVWLENDRDRKEQARATQHGPSVPTLTLGQLAWIEGIKLTAVLAWYFWKWRKNHQPIQQHYYDNEMTPIPARHNGDGGTTSETHNHNYLPTHNDAQWCYSSKRAYAAAVLSLCFLHVGYTARISFANLFLDPISLVLVVSCLPLLSLCLLRTLWSRYFITADWLSALLQICGIVIFKNIFVLDLGQTSIWLVFSYAMHQAIVLIFTDWVMKTFNRAFSEVSVGLFGASLVLSLVGVALSQDIEPALSSTHVAADITSVAEQASISPSILRLLCKAAIDVSELNILYDWGVVPFFVFMVMRSLSYVIGHILVSGILFNQPEIILGCAVAGVACWALYEQDKSSDEQGRSFHYGPILGRLNPGTFLPIFSFALTLALITHPPFPSILGNPDHQSPHSLAGLITQLEELKCPRKPLPLPTFYCAHCPNNRHGGPGRKRLHTFDDVLLIVFFSHARYDVNLDHYRDVYGEWFPNILFVGPQSREDKGFKHSYDVLVDSYMSDENLSDPKNYKMAGRMAHHMLYTALSQHPCYKGYLWAPFDALLNVPRLTLFDQERFWYHSFAGEYVWNPNLVKPAPPPNVTTTTLVTTKPEETNSVSLGPQAIKPNVPITQPVPIHGEIDALADGNYNKSRHAPPVVIGPDPKVDWTMGWRGWGPDWWWGDPHVGLKICYLAFLRAPAHMRDRMAHFFTDGTTRLIGGSADTLYIPGKYRQIFADTLELFLETECFLEIAVPTTVHLVAGELGEFHKDGRDNLEDDPVTVMKEKGIQYVDHWWIWSPPFNASFVRQKWAEGYEVDSMHTFHWGDADLSGQWRGQPEHIYDLRVLMKESAERQGIAWP